MKATSISILRTNSTRLSFGIVTIIYFRFISIHSDSIIFATFDSPVFYSRSTGENINEINIHDRFEFQRIFSVIIAEQKDQTNEKYVLNNSINIKTVVIDQNGNKIRNDSSMCINGALFIDVVSCSLVRRSESIRFEWAIEQGINIVIASWCVQFGINFVIAKGNRLGKCCRFSSAIAGNPQRQASIANRQP